MIELELFEIRIDETSSEQLIVLKEKDGERLMQIVIGIFEAQAIQLKVSGIEYPRPLTHDLLGSVIRAMGGKINRILINDLKDNTFFAQLVLDSVNGQVEVDARPSDAIALALRLEARIFVDDDVLDQVQQIQ